MSKKSYGTGMNEGAYCSDPDSFILIGRVSLYPVKIALGLS
jgi:hypothetical protein